VFQAHVQATEKASNEKQKHAQYFPTMIKLYNMITIIYLFKTMYINKNT